MSSSVRALSLRLYATFTTLWSPTSVSTATTLRPVRLSGVPHVTAWAGDGRPATSATSASTRTAGSRRVIAAPSRGIGRGEPTLAPLPWSTDDEKAGRRRRARPAGTREGPAGAGPLVELRGRDSNPKFSVQSAACCRLHHP